MFIYHIERHHLNKIFLPFPEEENGNFRQKKVFISPKDNPKDLFIYYIALKHESCHEIFVFSFFRKRTRDAAYCIFYLIYNKHRKKCILDIICTYFLKCC